MLPLIVALFWLAILAPWAVVKFRNARSEKSIDHFHAEHEVLSRQGYSVAPARRLDEAYLYEEHSYEPEHEPSRSRARLTVVQDTDTYSSLESRTSWDEWERDYDYDYDEPHTVGARDDSRAFTRSRYAAYASAPTPGALHEQAGFETPFDERVAPLGVSMRVRRNRIFTSLGMSALLTSGLNLLIGLSLLQYLAILSWTALVFYIAAALVAVSFGYLEVTSLLYRRTTRAFAGSRDSLANTGFDDQAHDDDSSWETAPAQEQWRREPRRYALG